MQQHVTKVVDVAAAAGAWAWAINNIPPILAAVSSILSIAWFLYQFLSARKRKPNDQQ